VECKREQRRVVQCKATGSWPNQPESGPFLP
jgi:hypothetical protein